MESETAQNIRTTVLDILAEADMEKMTEAKVRQLAAEKLGLDLSGLDHRKFIRGIVEHFLITQRTDALEAEAQDEPEGNKSGGGAAEYDDEGNLVICMLSNKRKVTIQEFRGKTLVSIREYYEKNGKQLPSSKGISLTAEQWAAFSRSVPAIEAAIKQLESR